mmetsp:Transcript_54180/g.139560  ORF Transcript_54180/g.139560 Transcript_54180/m.139560 type:complete len:219 (+) Transcript_54180:181-837(+)
MRGVVVIAGWRLHCAPEIMGYSCSQWRHARPAFFTIGTPGSGRTRSPRLLPAVGREHLAAGVALRVAGDSGRLIGVVRGTEGGTACPTGVPCLPAVGDTDLAAEGCRPLLPARRVRAAHRVGPAPVAAALVLLAASCGQGPDASLLRRRRHLGLPGGAHKLAQVVEEASHGASDLALDRPGRPAAQVKPRLGHRHEAVESLLLGSPATGGTGGVARVC